MLSFGADQAAAAIQHTRPGKAAELNPAAALTVLWLGLFAWAALGTMKQMIL